MMWNLQSCQGSATLWYANLTCALCTGVITVISVQAWNGILVIVKQNLQQIVKLMMVMNTGDLFCVHVRQWPEAGGWFVLTLTQCVSLTHTGQGVL